MANGEYKVDDVDRIFITDAIPSVGGVGGDSGLLSAQDKEKLDGLSPGGGVNSIALQGNTQVGAEIVVDGQLLDDTGGRLNESLPVVVDTFALFDATGEISDVTIGTEQMNTGAPAGKLSTAVIIAHSGLSLPGQFRFGVTSTSAGHVLVRATVDGAIVAQINLLFTSE